MIWLVVGLIVWNLVLTWGLLFHGHPLLWHR